MINKINLEMVENCPSKSVGSMSLISHTMGEVTNVQLAKLGPDVVVMKRVFRNPIPSDILKDELLKISSVKHENLNTFLGVCLGSENPCTLMLYASRGSLYDVIHMDTTKLSPDVKQSLILDVALGMRYLHSSSIGKYM